MARPSRDRRRSGPSRPPKPTRSEKTTVLIVCEGQKTEYHYFHRLKQEDRVKKNFRVVVKPGKGGSRQRVAQFALDRKVCIPHIAPIFLLVQRSWLCAPMPVHGHFRASGNRPGVYDGLDVAERVPFSYLLVSRPFTGVLFVATAGGPQAGLTKRIP